MSWINFILILGMTLLMTYGVFTSLLMERLPISLSETYYRLRERRKGCYFVFIIFSIAISILPIWLDKTEGCWYQFLVFIACISVLFVAITPDYRKNTKGRIHYISAYVACVSVLAYHIANESWPILVITLIPAAVSIFRYSESVVFFSEMALIYSIYLSLL